MQPLQKDDREALQETFAENGYFIVRNAVSKAKLSEFHRSIVAAFEQAKSSGQLFSGGGQLSGHLNCFPGEESRFAYDALQERGIIDLVKTLFPKAVRPPNV